MDLFITNKQINEETIKMTNTSSKINDLKLQFAKLDRECDELAQSSALAAIAAERAIKQRNHDEKLYAQKCDNMGEIKAQIKRYEELLAEQFIDKHTQETKKLAKLRAHRVKL
jgi:hypothetical protein